LIAMSGERTPDEPRVVWDPMVRVGHWSLAAFFLLAYALGGDRLNLHSHAGYTVALLVVFRVLWGFVGPQSARFADFVVGPARVGRYLSALASARSPKDLRLRRGHDPAGGMMIVALLTMLAVTTCSGLVLFAMEGRGPLPRGWVESWPGAVVESVHHTAADLSLLLVVAHVSGVLVMSVLLRQNLVAAMLHGRRRGADAGS
jgi:cytochrome b